MDIKRVDDKKMEIHKKEKAKLHLKKEAGHSAKKMVIHTKDMAVTRAGAVKRKTLSQVEGGEEIDGAIIASQTTVNVAKNTARNAKEMADIAKRIKRINKGKRLAKKKAIKQAKNIAKKVPKKIAKKTSKEGTKIVAKETAKVATEAAVTVAGTATTGPAGPLIGIGVGELMGIKMDAMDVKYTNRKRKLKFFMDKLQSEDKQTDNLAKLVKDLFMKHFSMVAKYVIKFFLLALLLVLILIAIVAALVMVVIAILYNSPIALFLPPLESGDTVRSVSSAYMADFNREITDLATEHKDHDKGQIVYVDYEGVSTPNNLYDIVCVYMVKYGYENVAISMDDDNKANLKAVFDDMCTYTTTTTSETVGRKTEKTLNVNVSMKYYIDMIETYSFSTEQTELLNELMGSEYRVQLGYGSGTDGTGRTDVKNSLSEAEIKAITDKISDIVAKQVCTFALTKVGYPYSQSLRDSGSYFDCSSLAYYSWQSGGVDIKYKGANTAAAEGEYCANNGKAVEQKDMKPGDLVFYSFSNNGRYKNISHVAIYVGNGKIVEASDEKTGVIISNLYTKGLVMIGRPVK